MSSGILLVNKPVGMSSAQLVSRVKKVFKARKAGHTGTLDPFAEGLMIIGINNGTRLSRFFLAGDKRYTAEIMFGSETDTLDSTGTVTSKCSDDFFHNNPDFFLKENLNSIISLFEGPVLQVPPAYSALKHNGVPLYKLARSGNPVIKDAREVVVHGISITEISPPSITVDVSCSSGTYIRSLAADIGKKAGCPAHLSALRRTECCGFKLDNAFSLDWLLNSDNPEKAMIFLSDALPHLHCYTVGDDMKALVMNGVSIERDEKFQSTVNYEGPVKILDTDEQLIAIVELNKYSGRYNYCCVFHD